jgi:hypothetical protein
MKTFLASVALAAVIASPALAQQTTTTVRNPYLVQAPPPYASIYPDNRRHSANRANDVFDTSGRYVGSDPDPSVRSQLAHDPGSGD